MMIEFDGGKGNEENVHLVNPKHIVSIDIFPNDDVKIVLDNGTVYETNSNCFSIYDWERLQKLNIGGGTE